MGVEIDEPRGDHETADIADLRSPVRQSLSDFRHFAVGEPDIEHGVERLRGIDEPTAGENEIEGGHAVGSFSPRRSSRGVIITGLSPKIAQTLVTIGVDLSKMNTIGDLQGGLEEAERMLGYNSEKDGTAG